MPDDIRNLLKTENKLDELSVGETLQELREKTIALCNNLKGQSTSYDPKTTIDLIKSFDEVKPVEKRALYSEVSNIVFSLGDEECGTFASNLDNLLKYVQDEKNLVPDDCVKFTIKIYDHFNLACKQKEMSSKHMEKVKNAIKESTQIAIEDVKKELKEETKKVEKNYITILGIFSSIVLTFVGGLTFSTSVLQNIHLASIYRLLMVIDILALVLTNIIYLLVQFICKINDKTIKFFPIKIFNIIAFVFMGVIVLAWIFSANTIPEFLKQFFPW